MSKATDYLKAIAPTIASFLGSPAAGVAVELLQQHLGLAATDKADVEEYITSGKLTSADLAAIKQAEIAAKAKEQELGIRAEELIVKDRQGARDMFVATRSITPQVLSWFVIVATVFLEGYILLYGLPPVTSELVVGRVLGTLDTAFATVLAFWLGSSHGSSIKTDMMESRK